MGIQSKYETLTTKELNNKYPDKRCKGCKERKLRREFYTSSCIDGLSTYCKKCQTEISIANKKKRDEICT